jgi:hypothetical protein
MVPESSPLPQACDGECSSCSLDPAKDGAPRETPPFEGWSMVGASLLFFLAPLLLAATTAALLRAEGPAAQWAGGIGGLALGMALTSLIARRLGRR